MQMRVQCGWVKSKVRQPGKADTPCARPRFALLPDGCQDLVINPPYLHSEAQTGMKTVHERQCLPYKQVCCNCNDI